MPSCAQLKYKGCSRKFFNHYYTQWIQAKDIEIDDVMVFPRFNDKIKDKADIKISELVSGKLIFNKRTIAYKGTRANFVKDRIKIGVEFCRLAGYFMSEGYTNSRDCVAFCFLKKENTYINDTIALMKKVFGIELSKIQSKLNVDGVELIFYSKVLCNLFSKLFYTNEVTKKAHFKSLPHWTLELPGAKQAEIIKGWWRGDKGYTASETLMNQTKVLFLRLGVIPSIRMDSVENYKIRGKHFIGPREIVARHNMFHFNNLSFFEDKFNLLKEDEFKKFKTKSTSRHGWMIKIMYIYR